MKKKTGRSVGIAALVALAAGLLIPAPAMATNPMNCGNCR